MTGLAQARRIEIACTVITERDWDPTTALDALSEGWQKELRSGGADWLDIGQWTAGIGQWTLGKGRD